MSVAQERDQHAIPEDREGAVLARAFVSGSDAKNVKLVTVWPESLTIR